MNLKLVPVHDASDILPAYRETAVGEFLAYHNLGAPHRIHPKPELLIGACMDYRLKLRLPPDFAFVLRCAGANLGVLEFDVSFAIAVGGVRSICVIGHNECRMVDVASKRDSFVTGLIENAGWDRHQAEEHFARYAARYSLEDVVEFVWHEAKRLRKKYPGINVAPLVCSLNDQSLCQVADSPQPMVSIPRTG